MIDINELRQSAQSATPGPWYIGSGTHEGRNIYSVEAVTDDEGFTYNPVVATAEDDDVVCWEANARLIAAANPAVISELLDRLEATEEDRSTFILEMGKLCAQCDALRAKIEAAEKSDAESLAMYRKARDERDTLRAALQHEADCVEAAKAEIKALRAKIEAMDKQEPIGVLHVGSSYGEELQDWEFEANQCACDKLNEVYVSNPTSLSLYAILVAQGEEQ